MEQKSRIAILGGSGRTGRFLVNEFLQQQYPIKLLVRTPDNFKIQHELIQIIKGDACDPVAIDDLLQDCQAVISLLGQGKDEPLVAEAATKYILDAMDKHTIQRYILVAGLNIDVPGDIKCPKTIAATEWMKHNFPHIQEDRQKAYSRLVQSDLDWTMVRIPFIYFTGSKGHLNISLTNCMGDSITAGDIADFLVQQLPDNQFIKRAPFIANR